MLYALVWMHHESKELNDFALYEWTESERNVRKLFDTKEDAVEAFKHTEREWTWYPGSACGIPFYVIEGYAVFAYDDEEDGWFDDDRDDPICTPNHFYYGRSGLDLVSDHMDSFTAEEILTDGEIDEVTAGIWRKNMLDALNNAHAFHYTCTLVWMDPFGYTKEDFQEDWNFLYHKYYA